MKSEETESVPENIKFIMPLKQRIKGLSNVNNVNSVCFNSINNNSLNLNLDNNKNNNFPNAYDYLKLLKKEQNNNNSTDIKYSIMRKDDKKVKI